MSEDPVTESKDKECLICHAFNYQPHTEYCTSREAQEEVISADE